MGDPISAITTAVGLGSKVAGAASGGKGGGSPEQVNFPPFFSPGGITPEQEALAQYGLQEADVATGQTFGSSGTGMSTMATQATAGNRMGKAVAEGDMSNTDEDAMFKAFQNEQTAATQNLSNQSELSNLATQNLTNQINQFGKTLTTASNNSDFTQGANDVFNSLGG